MNRREDISYPRSALQFLELLANQFAFLEKKQTNKKNHCGVLNTALIFQTVPGIILSHLNNKHPHSRTESCVHISSPWLPLKNTLTSHHHWNIIDVHKSLFWEQY